MKNKNSFTTLFVTRKYPPQVGGMENFSYGLIQNYPGKKIAVTYGGSQKFLLFVYPWLFLKALFHCITKRIDLIHLGDGVMTPLGWVIKVLIRKKVVFTAHGKDINLKFRPYQLIMPTFFRRMDRVFCVSNSTIEECVKVGIPRDKCTFIPNGVNCKEFKVNNLRESLRKEIEEKFNLKLEGKKILLTTGRLSKRKGGLWFAENVMPKLSDDYVYLRVGADSTEVSDLKSWFGIKGISYGEKLKSLIKRLNLEKKVFWLGKVSFEDLKKCLNIADLFIMPNVKVKGDMEGFGIVIIEAGCAGTPVVGSGIEGIKDAVIDGKSGILVKSGDADSFINGINKGLTLEREAVQKFVLEHFSWKKVVGRYYDEFYKLVKNNEK